MPSFDPADIERLSNLQPHEIPPHLHPELMAAVLKRRQEKGLKAEKPALSGAAAADVARLEKRAKRRGKKQPTVRRGAGGRMESVRKPIAPVGDAEVQPKPDARFAAPGAKPRRGRTRSGKKIDKVTGKVVKPLVKRGEGGKIVGLSEEEKRAAVTTVLPAAGREVMDPKPAAQPIQPVGTLKRGGMRGAKGAKSASFPVIHSAVNAALHHLKNAHLAIAIGHSPDEHFQNFDAIHSNIQGMDEQLHQSLQTAKHLIKVSGGQNSPHLAQSQANITRRLGELREIHEANVQRAMAGREKKNGS